MTLPARAEVVVVGAGLAGLAAATTLRNAGIDVLVAEASDGVGGRVRTDEVDGFRLDRGFQVTLTAYPELERQLDVEALDLRRFDAGALVRVAGRFHRVGDPRRLPTALVSSAVAPVGTLADKGRLALLQQRLRRADPRQLLRGADATELEALRADGFSEAMIDRFFRPLLGGIQLDLELAGARQMADTILRCLTVGDAAVPARGMGAIPAQLVAQLPIGSVVLDTPVATVAPGEVRIRAGDRIEAERVVVATDGPEASRQLGLSTVPSRSASCVWYAARTAPFADRLIALDGSGEGPVANVAVLTNVAPEYAPPGWSLIAAACPGMADPEVEPNVRRQLQSWWGDAVGRWRHLRTDAIAHAQPTSPGGFDPKRRVALGDGLFVCGDHRDTPSIQGALYSGRRCADAVIESVT